MKKVLSRCDNGYFLEVDPIELKRKAIDLRDQILAKVERTNDPYGFYSITMPTVEAAIRGELKLAFAPDDQSFVSGNFRHDDTEGELPSNYDRAFMTAVAEFGVSLRAFSLEPPDEVIKDGLTYAWREMEEETDTPKTVKYW